MWGFWVIRAAAATPASAAHFVSLLLKLFPLIWRQDFLESLICLPSNLGKSRLGFFSKVLKLLPGVCKNLFDLRFLFRVELKVINNLIEPGSSVVVAVPSPVSVQGQGPGGHAEQEYA